MFFPLLLTEFFFGTIFYLFHWSPNVAILWKMKNFGQKKTRQIGEAFSRTVSYLFCTVLDLRTSVTLNPKDVPSGRMVDWKDEMTPFLMLVTHSGSWGWLHTRCTCLSSSTNSEGNRLNSWFMVLTSVFPFMTTLVTCCKILKVF